MNDPVPNRPAVRGRTSLERPGNAYELALHRIAADAHDRVAVAAHVEKREVRRQIGVRCSSGSGGVAGALVFEARAYAVMQQQVHGRFRAAADVRQIERTQWMVLGKAV